MDYWDEDTALSPCDKHNYAKLQDQERYWQELWIALSAADAVASATPLRLRHGSRSRSSLSSAKVFFISGPLHNGAV